MYYKDFQKLIERKYWYLIKKFYCLECGQPISEKEYFTTGLCDRCFRTCRLFLNRDKRKWERFTVEYQEWHYLVLLRDNFTCQRCRKKERFLEVHHTKSWAKHLKLRYNIDNGITLCRECHYKLDKFRRRFKTKD